MTTMHTPLTSEDIARIARKRVKAQLGWWTHAALYVCVTAFLWIASATGVRQHAWALYPTLGWGLGLVMHGLAVFVLGPHSAWRLNLEARERERLQRMHTPP